MLGICIVSERDKSRLKVQSRMEGMADRILPPDKCLSRDK